MTDKPSNVLLLLSDEHRPDALGCAGHPHVETPTLDLLADHGTQFTNAYCPSPLCAPCRAAFSTGRYVHEVGAWDNAASYGGEHPTWGEYFDDHGVSVTTVGKLDFQPGVQGFPEQLLPAYRTSPDINGLQRDPPIIRDGARERIEKAGPTDERAGHVRSDQAKTNRAIEWLRTNADRDGWVLSVNYILPHFPLTAEHEYYDRYANVDELPYDYPSADNHPILEELRDHFDGRGVNEETLRRTRRAYYALCTRLDDEISRVLDALDRLGLADDTLVVYASDHGEPLGDHETWWKCNMYEQSVGIPMIVAGPGIETQTVETPVSLLDLVPTMADAIGVETDDAWQGYSQWPVLRGDRPGDRGRAVYSEYHAHGTSCGIFMLRQDRYKYVHYPNNPDQLFDRDADPDEMENLASDPAYTAVRERFEDMLRAQVDPDRIDRQAHLDQRRRKEQPVKEWWGMDSHNS